MPLFLYFPLLKLERLYTATYHLTFFSFIKKISTVYTYLITYENFILVLLIKVFLVFLNRKIKAVPHQIDTQTDKQIDLQKFTYKYDQLYKLSMFLMLFLVVYTLVICRVPVIFIPQRYYILLQPISKLILLIDLYILVHILKRMDFGILRRFQPFPFSAVFSAMVIAIFAIQGLGSSKIIADRVFEMFHQYKGPVDFAVEYIQKTFDNPEEIVIATNYEEGSYMYYLGSKVIIGFTRNNFKEDLKMSPDIAIFRRAYIDTKSQMDLIEFLAPSAKYETIQLPVFDTMVNNMPELNNNSSIYIPRHFFKTVLPTETDLPLEILQRKKSE